MNQQPIHFHANRKRIVPQSHDGVPGEIEHQRGFSRTSTFMHKSALNFPDLPVQNLMGPGTRTYHACVTFPANEKGPLGTFQRQKMSEHEQMMSTLRDTEYRYGGPLESPRLATPTNSPRQIHTPRSSRGVHELLVEHPNYCIANHYRVLSLPSLFGGKRRPPHHRHLLAVSRDGERLKTGPYHRQQKSASKPQEAHTGSQVGSPKSTTS